MTFGTPEPLGVTPRGSGVNVAVVSAHATAIEFCLFEGEREVRRARLRGRIGDVFHDVVPDVPLGARYGLRAHGPFAPLEGHRFNPAKLLVDPYARALDRAFVLHPSMFGYRPDDPRGGLSFDTTDSAPFMPKAIVTAPGTRAPAAGPLWPWPRTVLYELHARGFTMRHPDIPAPLRGRFAGLANPAAIGHLVRLGVTSVELMPAAAWIDERHLAPLGLRNYWGYNPVAPMVPDPGLAPGGWAEVRATVAALAEAGIETILDVVLNHTGEGDELGPTVSLRGLDNATYYRLRADAPDRYIDDAGCGNILALDRPAPLRLAMDALRLWAAETGLHGFRFDLAVTLGRRAEGFDPAAPLLQAIAQDPVLRGLKLIAEPWDTGPGGYHLGAFPPQWGEWNDHFRDGVRRFWRGDAHALGELATRLAGSADAFGARGAVSRSVNFVVAHDGFTLADLVSYENKHNAANGEQNRDGTDGNLSWNNGAEGPVEDAAIRAARLADQRALLATLLLARGTPMLAMGSERGHTQGGNNNAYAQDNPTAWLDWETDDGGLAAWTARLIALRAALPALHGDRPLTGAAAGIDLLADVEWLDADGQPLTQAQWEGPGQDTLAMVLAGGGEAPERVAVVLHRGRAERMVRLPAPRAGHLWHLQADSAAPAAAARALHDGALTARPRSVLVAAERPVAPRGAHAADPGLLARLSHAAGIAPDWYDHQGRRTHVGEDTRRALLTAMRLPCATAGEARDTLRRLSEETERRAVPEALVVRGDVPVELALTTEPGLTPGPVWLEIEHEDGARRRLRLEAGTGTLRGWTGLDGRPAQHWRVPLPALPPGRHRLWRDDAPETLCHLIVAPARCFVPASIARGGRRFGIGAQLYALRRAGDGGVGDFTTLARLAEVAGRHGASLVGVNPLHMLFPQARERASPYHPSDRRFLDPLYIDTGQPFGAAGGDVAYAEVWRAKLPALEAAFAALDPADAGFAAFMAEGGAALRDFATFQAIAEARGGESWRDWPDGLRAPADTGIAAFAAAHDQRVRFHQVLQFLADRQLRAAAEAGRSAGLEMGLYRDLAVGAAADGAEAWAAGEDLADGAWVGAPPDPLAPQGQNWHLPPPIPLRCARGGYAGFAALLRANMRHAGVLRIDHVMGLSRLFWIPAGGTGADGTYVAYPLADLLGQVALESARARCLVIGEDLGTVADGFREQLVEAGLLGYRVLLLERDDAGFRPPSQYPARAVACVTTHDLPPLAGWWEGADIAERAAVGLLRDGQDAVAERDAERRDLTDALTRSDVLAVPAGGEPAEAAVVVAAHAFVAATQCDLVLVQADDLAGARVGVNLPGTDTERPNWRHRLDTPVETLLEGARAGAILETMNAAGRGRGGS